MDIRREAILGKRPAENEYGSQPSPVQRICQAQTQRNEVLTTIPRIAHEVFPEPKKELDQRDVEQLLVCAKYNDVPTEMRLEAAELLLKQKDSKAQEGALKACVLIAKSQGRKNSMRLKAAKLILDSKLNKMLCISDRVSKQKRFENVKTVALNTCLCILHNNELDFSERFKAARMLIKTDSVKNKDAAFSMCIATIREKSESAINRYRAAKMLIESADIKRVRCGIEFIATLTEEEELHPEQRQYAQRMANGVKQEASGVPFIYRVEGHKLS